MDPMPLAGVFCETAEEAARAAVFPLTWVQCSRCSLVQVLEDVEDSTLFRQYNYASSTVPGLVRHFEGFAALLRSSYPAGTRFLEIGCNDGVLLNRLPRDWKLTGVDPSDVATRFYNREQYTLLNAPFTVELVRQGQLEQNFNVVSGSNCLAHISDLKAVFEAAFLALAPGGHFWIEVHDLEALLRGCQWDTIYHEHKVEWSAAALQNCLAGAGFTLRSLERIPMHGGALRACFAKEQHAVAAPVAGGDLGAPLESLHKAYLGRYEAKAARTLLAAQKSGDRFAAYGAAGRANVYLNQMPELRFSYIIDESPLRMNKFLPGVGTPVTPPDRLLRDPVSRCLITAWNYREDIVRKNPGFAGTWLTAFGDE